MRHIRITHLEGLLEQRLLGPFPRVSDSVGPEEDTDFACTKVPSEAYDADKWIIF